MARKRDLLLFGLFLLVIAPPLVADDLTGEDTLLCSPSEVRICLLDEDCVLSSPWKLNIPSFIEIDLKEKTMATTKASGENRSTPIKNLERANGLIILQGAEGGRAFSFMIVEETGMLTTAVTMETGGVVGFGVCTPLPGR